MASRSPEFLTAETESSKKNNKKTAGRRSSLVQSIKADLMLMLAGDAQDKGKIPLFHFHEGHA